MNCATGLAAIGFLTLWIPCAPGAPGDKQKIPVKAIIRYQQELGGPVYFGDLLEGLDYSKDPPVYTDERAVLKVGLFARKETDGTWKKPRYEKKTLYPDKDYLPDTLVPVRMGLWLEDLEAIHQRKLKACKNERDKELRRRRYARLLNWCRSNFLFRHADKIEGELKRLDRGEEEDAAGAGSGPGEDLEAKNRELAQAFGRLPGAGEVLVRSSRHLTYASDHLPPKTLDHLLALGESVYREFEETMYDPSLDLAAPLPDREIIRFLAFKSTATFEEAMKKAGTLSPCRDETDPEKIRRCLGLGGDTFADMNKERILITCMTCSEIPDPEKPGELRETEIDHDDELVHFLNHALMNNRFRNNRVAGSEEIVMPWLQEGMAIHTTLKHLGTKNTACVDFPVKKDRYAQQGEKKDKGFEAWFGDVEAMVNRIALEDSADPFGDMVRIPNYHTMKPETVAKAFSMIDFLMESDRLGFLRFIDRLQQHYKVLYEGHDLAAFLKGLEGLVAESFEGAAVAMGRKTVPLDSVETLEEAWRDWARNYLMPKSSRK